MLNSKVYFYLPVLLLLIAQAGFAITEISGDVYDGNGGPLIAGTYYVSGEVTIPEGQTLTIEGGAILKFRPGKNFNIDGVLNVHGLANDRVFFTSKDDNDIGENHPDSSGNPEPGDWPKIEFNQSSSGIVKFAVFRYGGRWAGGTNTNVLTINGKVDIFDCFFTLNLNTNIVINNSISQINIERTKIRGAVNGAGISIEGIANTAIRDCVIEQCEDEAIHLDDPTNLITCTFENIQAVDNNVNAIHTSGMISKSGAIAVTTLPIYLSWDIEIGSNDPAELDITVNVAPGVVFKSPNRSIQVFDKLNFNGTTDNPIIMTSEKDDSVGGDVRSDGIETQPGPGQWSKLEYNEGSSGTINHSIFRYGGRWGGGTNTNVLVSNGTITVNNSLFDSNQNSAILLEGNTVLDNLKIINCVDGHGIRIGDAIVSSVIRNCEIDHCEDSAVYMDNPSNLLTCSFENITATNNDVNAIDTHGTITISGDITTTALPIFIDQDIEIGDGDPDHPNVIVNVKPGVVFKLKDRAFRVHDTLNIQGTASAPVIFTSDRDDSVGGDTRGNGAETVPKPGQWPKLEYNEESKGTISHAILRYGGQWGGGTSVSMLDIFNPDMKLSDVLLEYSRHDAIKLTDGHYTLERVIAQNNNDGGLWLAGSGSTTISSSQFTNNDDDGILLEDDHSLNATGLLIANNQRNGVYVKSQGTIKIHQSDIVDNQDWGVEMREPIVADFMGNYWGDDSGPFDDNSSVQSENDQLNLINSTSTANRVTDFVNWGNSSPGSFLQPPVTGDFPTLVDGFNAVLLHQFQGAIPVFGNNLVACSNGESIIVDRRGDGDYLVWLTADGQQDIARTSSSLQIIQGIVPASGNAIQVLVENMGEGSWLIYQMTGPIYTAVKEFMQY